MSEKALYISKLIQKKLQIGLSEKEQVELDAWLSGSELNRSIYNKLHNDDWVKRELEKFEHYDHAGRRDGILGLTAKPSAEDLSVLPENNEGLLIDGRKRFVWKRWIAAASVILAIGIGSYYIFFNNTNNQSYNGGITGNQTSIDDIKAPETNRAMITLADGRKVYLDSTESGQLAVQGNVKLIKLADGQIAYQTSNGEVIKRLQYNTLSNPRGSKVIDITLSDGTKVWLNNESSLRYPVAFIGRERAVEITGEAYFEVSHDPAKPFRVSVNGAKVEVLGTHFNVNSYSNEKSIKATLVEGSIKVSKNENTKFIKPGEQAQLYSSGTIDIKKDVDIGEVIAWKDGYFRFSDASTEDIMQQVMRWYDVDVVYQGDIKNERFGGSLPRSANASQLLNILELTKTVEFSIEDKKIIVKPYK